MFGANYLGGQYFGGTQQLLNVAIPTWVSPSNHATGVNQTTDLIFVIPQAQTNLHFEIQIDTVNTFNTGNLQDIKSWLSQTGWQYFNGTTWVSIPSIGVDPSYAGNQAKYTIQSGLAPNTWYRRVRGRVLV